MFRISVFNKAMDSEFVGVEQLKKLKWICRKAETIKSGGLLVTREEHR